MRMLVEQAQENIDGKAIGIVSRAWNTVLL